MSSAGKVLVWGSHIYTFARPTDLADYVEKLSSHWTAILFVILGSFIGAKHNFGSPIQCWVPYEHRKSWEEYAETYCFIQNTYYLPLNDSIATTVSTNRRVQHLSYYQWAPWILLLMALLIRVPKLFWFALNSLLGVNLDIINDLAMLCMTTDGEKHDNALRNLGKHMSSSLKLLHYKDDKLSQDDNCYDKCMTGVFRFIDKWIKPHYITTSYLILKLMTVAVVVALFYLLNALLGTKDTMYGYTLLVNLLHGRDWQVSGIFPRVTYCDYKERIHSPYRSQTTGTLTHHTWTVQCVLMTNMFNEVAFGFIWFWLVIMAFINVVDLCIWFVQSITPYYRLDYISQTIIHPEWDKPDKMLIKAFVFDYLQSDGVLIIRLIDDNYGPVVAARLVFYLWRLFVCEKANSNKYRGGQYRRRTRSEQAAVKICNHLAGTNENDSPPSTPSAFQNQYLNYLAGSPNEKKKKMKPKKLTLADDGLIESLA